MSGSGISGAATAGAFVETNTGDVAARSWFGRAGSASPPDRSPGARTSARNQLWPSPGLIGTRYVSSLEDGVYVASGPAERPGDPKTYSVVPSPPRTWTRSFAMPLRGARVRTISSPPIASKTPSPFRSASIVTNGPDGLRETVVRPNLKASRTARSVASAANTQVVG